MEQLIKFYNKLLPYLFILRHTKYTLPMMTKMALYYSYFNSNISYMIPIWRYTTMNHMNRLQKTQNKAIRSLFWEDYRDPNTNTNANYKKHNILKISQLTLYNSLVTIYKIKNNLIKNSIQLTTFTVIRQYNTRGRHNFIMPRSTINALYESTLVGELA